MKTNPENIWLGLFAVAGIAVVIYLLTNRSRSREQIEDN